MDSYIQTEFTAEAKYSIFINLNDSIQMYSA